MFVGSRRFLAGDVVGRRRRRQRRGGVDARGRERVAPGVRVDVAFLEEQCEFLTVQDEGAVAVLPSTLAADGAQHGRVHGIGPERRARAREEDTLPAAGGRIPKEADRIEQDIAARQLDELTTLESPFVERFAALVVAVDVLVPQDRTEALPWPGPPAGQA